MWSSEDFPGADQVPWPYLIRARYQFEVDAVIASMVARAALIVAPRGFGAKIAKAAVESTRFGGGREEAPAERRVAMLNLVADWDGDLCPKPRPWPRFDELTEIGDPSIVIVLERAMALLEVAGSEQLQKALGSALEQGGFQQRAA